MIVSFEKSVAGVNGFGHDDEPVVDARGRAFQAARGGASR
jgi:hypothetical protein